MHYNWTFAWIHTRIVKPPAVLGIRIRRIRMLLGHPDPLVTGIDPDPDSEPYLFPLICWADWKNTWQNIILTQNVSKKLNFLIEDDVPVGKLEKKYEIFLLLNPLKKVVGSGVESGSWSISQRYGSGDPDPHQNVTDPQHPQHWPAAIICRQIYESILFQILCSQLVSPLLISHPWFKAFVTGISSTELTLQRWVLFYLAINQ